MNARKKASVLILAFIAGTFACSKEFSAELSGCYSQENHWVKNPEGKTFRIETDLGNFITPNDDERFYYEAEMPFNSAEFVVQIYDENKEKSYFATDGGNRRWNIHSISKSGKNSFDMEISTEREREIQGKIRLNKIGDEKIYLELLEADDELQSYTEYSSLKFGKKNPYIRLGENSAILALQKAAVQKCPECFFFEDDFSFLCSAQGGIEFALNFHLWNNGNRGTSRLVVFRNGDAFGNYYAPPLILEAKDGIFVFQEENTGEKVTVDLASVPDEFFACGNEFRLEKF